MRADDALSRLTAAPGRARHGLVPKALHLVCEGVSRLVGRGQVVREGDDLDGEPREEDEDEQASCHTEQLGSGQPRTASGLAWSAHFAITAHTAIAAARSPINTGMIIW
ncbi:hypothetical protein GCM10010341_73420 [Streptomyces noursei]|nr:hypothetical protein GCM10010341_73420 [Streptomyces noursei]